MFLKAQKGNVRKCYFLTYSIQVIDAVFLVELLTEVFRCISLVKREGNAKKKKESLSLLVRSFHNAVRNFHESLSHEQNQGRRSCVPRSLSQEAKKARFTSSFRLNYGTI